MKGGRIIKYVENVRVKTNEVFYYIEINDMICNSLLHELR